MFTKFIVLFTDTRLGEGETIFKIECPWGANYKKMLRNKCKYSREMIT